MTRSLSSPQQGVWFEQLLHPALPRYNIGMVMRLDGPLSVPLLEQSINLTVSRHSALRLAFTAGDGAGAQYVRPSLQLALEVDDLRGVDDADTVALDRIQRRFVKPFDLTGGPLVDVHLVRTADERHYWLLRGHHLVSDGYSMSLTLRDVAQVYTDLARGAAGDSGSSDYLDAIDDDSGESSRAERSRDFWRARFAELPEPLFERPATLSADPRPSRRLTWSISRERMSALEAWAAGHGLGAPHLLSALLAAWFSRVTGRSDIVIGIPVHNRGSSRLRSVHGMFASMIPLVVRVSDAQTFEELMTGVAAELRACYRHQRLGILEINRAVGAGRAGRGQLYDISLSYEPFDGDVAFGEATNKVIPVHNGWEPSPLGVYVRDYHRAAGPLFEFNYDSAVVPTALVQSFRDGMECMMDALLDGAPGHAIGQLPLMPAAPRARIVDDFNRTAADLGAEQCLHELFAEQVRRAPENIALVAGEDRLSYAELDARVGQLAAELRAAGVGRGAHVGIILPRSAELVATMLAVLRTGAAYIPLDPSLPVERMQMILDDACPAAVIDRDGVRMLRADGRADGAADVTGSAEPHDAAYVIYTSGTTGRPKGVIVEHRNVVNFVRSMAREPGLSSEDTVLALTTVSFDIAVLELLAPLCAGARVVIAGDGALMAAASLRALIVAERVTLVQATPAGWRLLLDGVGEVLHGVRALCGGEALTGALAAELVRRCAAVWNMYGPTETTVWSTLHRVTSSDVSDSVVAIGRPIANTCVRILDPAGAAVPVGVPGELCIGGAGVTRGYLNRSELTAERFAADPFDGGRFYRTGDRARWREDGVIEFLGRTDFQLKIRGYRVEPAEIEMRVGAVAGVRDVVVTAQGEPGAQRLVAHYVTVSGEPLGRDMLRESLVRELPEYMVPTQFIHLPQLPLTTSGKIDRRALPLATPGPERTGEPPRDEWEQAACDAVMELLGVDRVSPDDNFFELGGHSLVAVALVNMLRDRTGRELPLTDVFLHPRIREIADGLRGAPNARAATIGRADRSQPLVLSPAQRRLWILDRLEHTGAAYHLHGAVRIHGPLDTAALQCALDALMSRHESLRTVFFVHDGEPRQRVLAADTPFPLRFVDLSGAPAGERDALAAQHCSESVRVAMDLACGPLAHGTLIRTDDDEHTLSITLHHIIADGVSLPVLVRELGVLYNGGDESLPPLPLQFADYAVWQHQNGRPADADLDWWAALLQDAPPLLTLPTDCQRPPVTDYCGRAIPVRFASETLTALDTLTARHGTTRFMTVLAAWSVLLGRLARQDDVVVGAPVANRPHAALDGVIGFFANTLALRADLSGAPSVGEVLRRVRVMVSEAQRRQAVPFDDIVERLRPVRSTSHAPLFQVMLAWQREALGALAIDNARTEPVVVDRGAAAFDLTLSLHEHDGCVAGVLEYATSLFHESTVTRWVGYLERLIRGMAADPDVAVSALQVIDQDEVAELLKLSGTDRDHASTGVVLELVEAQARRTPDACAVRTAGEELTYAELDARSTVLARRMVHAGVQAETLAGVFLPRSIDRVVALLATWKAGGAWVPLDPAYPDERLAWLIDDCRPSLILTCDELADRMAGVSDTCAMIVGAEEAVPAAELPLVRSHDLAYVIHTSGSTGTPKGVAIEHGGIVNLVIAQSQILSTGPGDRVLQTSSFTFDMALSEMLVPLCTGATVVLPDDVLPAGALLQHMLERERITHAFLTPSVVATLDARRAPASLRTILMGGEALPAAMATQWSQRLRVVNGYGPTEATVATTHYIVTGECAAGVPIGRPFDNVHVHVTDESGALVPRGAYGEILISGVGVARGYINRAQLTAERFVTGPDGRRAYRSGDVGRWLPDGNLECAGRTDDQVKVRGFRIEPGEVAAHLMLHAAVGEAAVVAHDDAAGMRRLVAYLVMTADADDDALREHVTSTLPEYMLPSIFMRVPALPRTRNGKLDRRALPEPSVRTGFQAPRTPSEVMVASLFADILGLPRVARDDDFFQLGGHSLLAVSLIERLQAAGLDVGVHSLYATPTPAALAATGRPQAAIASTSASIPAGCEHVTPAMLPLCDFTQAQVDAIVAAMPGGAPNVEDIYPLTPLQRGIWFQHLLNPTDDLYVTPMLFAFDDHEHRGRYIAAIEEVVARHAILRTAIYAAGPDAPVQVVLRNVVVDMVEFPPCTRAALMHTPARSLDMGRAPLLRLVTCDDADGGGPLLLILSHHLILDHTTARLLVDEVRIILDGRSSELPPSVPFRGFVEQALNAPAADQEAFFRTMLGDVDESTAPFGLTDADGGASTVRASLALDADVAHRVRVQARSLGVGPAALMHAAWARLVAAASNSDDVVFGTVLFGRMTGQAGVERALGMFINTLPLRVRTAAPVAEVVRSVHSSLAALLRHEHTPLHRAIACSSVKQPASLFTSLLNYRYSPPGDAVVEGVRLVDVAERSNFPLSICIDDEGAGFTLSVDVMPALDPARLCRSMAVTLERIVDALENGSGVACSAVPVLDVHDARELVELGSGPRTDVSGTVLDRLHDQARERPDAAAVIHAGERVSYASLLEYADAVTGALQQAGVPVGSTVGVCTGRSAHAAATYVGVLQAGCVWLPLDPAYPDERLAFMLADSAPALVFCTPSLVERLRVLTDVPLAVVPASGARGRRVTPAPHAPAYVIYTSGSTGRPKGVVVEHRGLPNLVDAQVREAGIGRDSRVLQVSSLSFDASVSEMLMALCSGAALVIPEDDVVAGLDLHELMERESVTHVTLTPSVLATLDASRPPSSLEVVIAAGEALPAALAMAWLERVRLFNAYGPTEATVCATMVECTAERLSGSVPIGRPLQNVTVSVVDRSGALTPRGATGEIVIGGIGVAHGYLGRSELSAERFVTLEDGARGYRTGDLGRWRADGMLEYAGRTDAQVKVRGVRIDPGEVAARLHEHPAVRDAAVVMEGSGSNARLVAYVVTHIDVEELRQHAALMLPDAMMPGAWVVVEDLARTVNGKLDRASLPAAAPDFRAFEPPRSERERAICDAFVELLGVQRAGRNDSFFALGGHSLLAITLLDRLRGAGITLSVRTLFANPTPARLAASSEEAAGNTAPGERTAGDAGVPPGTTHVTPAHVPLANLSQAELDRVVLQVPGGAANVQDVYPLTPLQQGLLFHHLADQADDPYVSPSLLAFDTASRRDQFLDALQQVIARHDILRTSFVTDGITDAVQVVCRNAALEIEEAGEATAEELLQTRGRIDVRRAPLLRCVTATERGTGRCLLLVYTHHLILDHATLAIAVDEVREILRGNGAALPVPVPFRQFVHAALAQQQDGAYRAFFQEMLADVDEPTAPFGMMHLEGAPTGEARTMLDPALAARIRATATARGVTPAILLHLAWARLLGMLSARDDVVFGTVLLGRMNGGADAGRALGMFINTLPLRVRLDRDAGAAVRTAQLDLSRLVVHEHAPLADVQRCSGIRAPLPLFTSILNYRHGGNAPVADGIETDTASERTAYPLSASIDDDGVGFGVTVQVRRPHDASSVMRWLVRIIEQLTGALDTGRPGKLVELQPMDADESATLVRRGDVPATVSEPELVNARFASRVAESPGAIAVLDDSRTLTYRALDERAGRLAYVLRDAGVVREDRVLVCLPRSADLAVTLMATLRAGGVYVPVDPSHPDDRINLLVADATPRVVITSRELAPRFAAMSGPALVIVDSADDAAPLLPPQATHAEDAAYVIYTSGTTGRPKGVVVEHGAIAHHCAEIARVYGTTSADRQMFLASPSFDVSIEQMLVILLEGGCIVVPAELPVGVQITRLVQEHRITILNLPPALFRHWIESLDGERGLETLRQFLVGGEAMPVETVVALRGRLQRPIRLLNGYGPTETSITCTVSDVAGPMAGVVPIGRPVAGTHVIIGDRRGEPVPDGVTGEIWIGGARVARGYLGDDPSINERFRVLHGKRFYRSGDLGRWRGDGEIEFVGRVDDQVKLRGFRIEPAEIESRLLEHHGVDAAAVIVRVAAPVQQLVAYWVGRNEVDGEDLRRHLALVLPEYMVPSVFVRLDVLPLTVNGKLDRAALPDPGVMRASFTEPSTPTEVIVAAAFAEVLGVECISRDDDFFALGGHSLLAMALVSRLRLRLRREASLTTLFTSPRVSSLAAALDAAPAETLPPITPVSRVDDLPLAQAQQRLWLIDQLEDTGAAYHIAGGLRLRGDVDVERLQHALDGLVARHESLRTVFPSIAGLPRQRVMPPGAGFQLATEDVRAADERDSLVRAAGAACANDPFDITAGPLVRGRLLRTGVDEYVLWLCLHHIIADGWSLGILTRELAALYRGEALSPMPVQYADYAVWQQEYLTPDRLQVQADYWAAQLRGAPALLELPTDHPRPARQDYRGTSIPVTLDADLSDALRSLAQRSGTTLFATLLASWAMLLSRLSGQEDVVIGTPSAGRVRPELEPLIGCFVNTLALRLDLGGDPEVSEMVSRVHAVSVAAQEHQDLPFEQVIERVQPVRTLAHAPLFQVMVSWQNTPAAELSLPGVDVDAVAPAQDAAQFDLSLSIGEHACGIGGVLNYATALYEQATLERWLGHWQVLLRAMVEDETRRIGSLPLLTDAEFQRVIHDFNQTASDYADDATVHGLFEAQAARTPHAVALSYDGSSTTFGELDRAATQLAHHLAATGVQHGDRVAVFLERTPELVTALLAVLKCGAAYVPLDPRNPDARLAWYIEDARPAALITVASLRDRLPTAAAVVDLDDVWNEPATAPDMPVASGAGDLAYVLYTSGSTGTPKAVMVEHRSVVNHVAWQSREFGFSCDDVFLQRTSFAFDASVWELWTPLALGARMVLLPTAAERDPAAILSLLASGRVSVVQFVPSLLQVLAATADRPAHRVRWLFAGGEPLTSDIAERARPLAEGIVNLYGPTEATIDATFHVVPEGHSGPVPIGRPVSNARIYVLDTRDSPVPVGVAGEICIAGAGIARGYLERPDLTAERFAADPFVAGARMYRSGDIGRWREDGALEFLGRRDTQVKLRGFRIELGEIAACLRRVPGITDAAVVVRDEGAGEQRIVAYCVQDGQHDADALRELLRSYLPEYMVPSAFIAVDAIPLTVNGKLDERALPDPAFAASAYEAPRDRVEEAVCTAFSNVLGVDRVGRADDFFRLGGHSLLAIALMERLRGDGLVVDIRSLFSDATPAALAATARSADTAVAVSLVPDNCARITPDMVPLSQLDQHEIDLVTSSIPGGARNVADIYRLTPLQEGLLLQHLMDPVNDPYVMSSVLAFDDAAEREAFISALRLLVMRHDVLRTSFVADGLDAPVQAVWREAAPYIAELAPQRIDQLLHVFADTPMDTGVAPVLRLATCEEAGTGRALLLLQTHHLLLDQVTAGMLVAQAAAIMQGEPDSQLHPAPYRNFVALARDADAMEGHRQFFEALLGDVFEPTAPAGFDDTTPAPTVESRVQFDPILSHRLRAVARAHGVSPATVLHAAWGRLVAQLAGRDDITFGTVLLGRLSGGDAAATALGMFINTLPMRVDTAGTVGDVVRRVHDGLAGLLLHEHAPLSLAQRCSGVPAPAPLFTTLLNYRHVGAQAALHGIDVHWAPPRSTYPLALAVDDHAGGEFVLTLQARQGGTSRDLAQRVASLVARMVEALETDVPVPMQDLAPVAGGADVARMPSVPRAAGGAASRAARAFVPPATVTEAIVAQAFADVLRVERVGRDDDFFALGGHSLLALTLLARLKQRLGRAVSLSTLFASPRVRELAAALDGAEHEDLLPIPAADRTMALPMSAAQQRLWYVTQMLDTGSAYHIAGGMRLHGPLDGATLQRAFDAVVARHESLRTVFDDMDDGPVQRVLAPTPVPLKFEDLRGAADADARLSAAGAACAGDAFDLGTGPLLRGHLLRMADDEHVLWLCVHHIVADGWSLGIIMRELATLYRGEELPPLGLQYADYAAWQRSWLSSERIAAQAGYWEKQLLGAPAPPQLPGDRPRPALPDYRGDSFTVRLDEALTEALRELSRRHGCTQFMTLLASWALLLSRLSGQHDMIIGAPVAGRSRTEFEPLVGLFLNTLALRVDLSGDPDVGALLRRVRAMTLAAQDHQDLPFEAVYDHVQRSGTRPQAPLFNVMFAWQNAPEAESSLDGVTHEAMELPLDGTQFDLNLVLGERDGIVQGVICFASTQFDARTVERWIEQWKQLLRAMVEDDTANVATLPMLSDAQRRRVVHEFNATTTDYPAGMTLHGQFARQVRRTPDATALTFEDTHVSYSELDARADRLASVLIAEGVRAEDGVGICMHRSIDLVVALLATLKAGAAYVPFDPEYPAARLHGMLEDAAVRLVLTDRAAAASLAGTNARVLHLDTLAVTMDAGQAAAPAVVTSSQHAAYVIFTSGSTGRPKGVINEHGAVCNRICWMQEAMQLGSDDVVLQKTPYSFDVSVWEFFWPLLYGARLVIAAPGGHRDPDYLTQVIHDERITTLHFVPSMLQAFLTADVTRTGSVRRVVCSGEALSAELAAGARAAMPHAQLWNLYGPTEAAVDVTAHLCDGTEHVSVPIGRPIANTRIYILDATGEPVPVGVPGEIMIGGVQVARGYINRDDLTRERFARDPFSAEPGARMYRTGDLAWWREDGVIEYLGRTDFQVKIRGMRIEPAEIETVLAAVPGVAQAAVDARTDTRGELHLIGWYVPRPGAAIDSGMLREALSERLPAYMVPHVLMSLDALPLSSSGKLDRRALPDADVMTGPSAFEEPRGAVEQAVAAAFADALSIPRIGRHDSFFDLGGHSLLAISLIRLLSKQGFAVSIASLFAHSTVATLAEHLSRDGADLHDRPVILRAGAGGTPLFLVHEISGEVLYGPRLARQLPPPFPIYGLLAEPYGDTPPRTIQAAAARLRRQLRTVQPSGPYRLAGWSLGGVIAWELAAQLVGDGDSVEVLALFDSSAPDGMPLPERSDRDLMVDVLVLLQRLTVDDPVAGIASIHSAAATCGPDDAACVLDASRAAGAVPDGWSDSYLLGTVHRSRAYAAAASAYHPPRLDVDVNLFRATGSDTAAVERWRSLTAPGRLHVADVPGDHLTMMNEPHVETLGRLLGDALRPVPRPASRPARGNALVSIRPGRGGTVVCVPGAGGGVLTFAALAESVDGLAVHGVQHKGLLDEALPFASVEAAAAACVEEIERAGMHAPLHIVGHSFGGWIAFEVALRLQERGRTPAGLILIDTEAPTGHVNVREYDDVDGYAELIDVLELSAGRSLDLDAVILRELDHGARLLRLHTAMVGAGLMPASTSPAVMAGVVRTFLAALRTRYEPATAYLGPVELVLPDPAWPGNSATLGGHARVTQRWRRHAPGIVISYAEADHMSLLAVPHVGDIARSITHGIGNGARLFSHASAVAWA